MKNFSTSLLTGLFGLLLFNSSCTEDEPAVVVNSRADVIVINEGNFQSGDATFSTYNSSEDQVTQGAFVGANGFPIGATIQNALVLNGNIYAVTNTADKLEIIDAETFESKAFINSGLSNPYSFAAVGSKAYVTNWGTLNFDTFVWENSFIAVIDLATNTLTDSILLDFQPQHVLAVGDDFYVTNVGANYILVYDGNTNQEIKQIETAQGPDKMVLDASGDLWVICTSGSMIQLDTETQEVIKTISGIATSGYNEKMVINQAGDKIYYLSSSGFPDYKSDIYELSTDADQAPTQSVVSGENYYGLGISPDNILFVADANAFQGNGTVLRYNLDGSSLSSFPVGRGPNGFIFR